MNAGRLPELEPQIPGSGGTTSLQFRDSAGLDAKRAGELEVGGGRRNTRPGLASPTNTSSQVLRGEFLVPI
jgi:hypothetical protein